MDHKQAHQVLMLLQANYPDCFRGMSKEAAEVKINLWADMFADEPFELVVAAAKAYIASDTRSFMPTIGQIKDRIATMRFGREMTELEAWNIVAAALRNSAYGAEEEFAKLPSDIKRVVGSPTQLREWGLMERGEVETVVASNFQRSYRTRQARDRDYQKLPQAVKRFIGQFTETQLGRLEEGDMKNVGTP